MAEQLRVKSAPMLAVILAGCWVKVGKRAARKERESDHCYCLEIVQMIN